MPRLHLSRTGEDVEKSAILSLSKDGFAQKVRPKQFNRVGSNCLKLVFGLAVSEVAAAVSAAEERGCGLKRHRRWDSGGYLQTLWSDFLCKAVAGLVQSVAAVAACPQLVEGTAEVAVPP